MRAVTRVIVKLTRYVAAQTLALARAGQLCGQLAHEAFGFVDDRWDFVMVGFYRQPPTASSAVADSSSPGSAANGI